MRDWRGRFAHVLLVLAVAVLPWSVPAVASPAPQLAPASEGRGARAVESGLTFLLDRYAQPLEPAPLLQAAWAGLSEGAPETLRPALASLGDPAIAGDRAAAWSEFQRRFDALVAAGGDADALAHEANRAMARSLDDCHTRFAPSYDKEMASYEGGERYGGIGASALDPARFEPRPPGPVIVGLVDGGPAARAGIQLGDSVIGVDDVDVTGWQNSRVVELVRGAPGSTVRLRLDRPGMATPIVIPVERAEIENTLVESRLMPGQDGELVGYVQLKTFVRSVEPLLPQAMDELRAQGAQRWVLDLRNNGGGSVPTFAAVASLFIKEGTLGVTTDRNGAETLISTVRGASPHKEFARPLAVLVNSLSASASELLAADLQEYGAGRVFGETTAGCFGNSQLFRLPDRSAMWITVRSLQSGLERRDVHKQGVTPDEVVRRSREDLAQGRDPQLDAALAWLGSG